MGTITTSKRQLAWVFDLNKCIGCQTCSVACKVLWTQDEGPAHMWWMTVNTQPGKGTPKDWESMGGGYRNGKQTPGKLPTAEEFGGGWDYNYDEVLRGGKGREVHLQKTAGSKSWGMNWDEDEGGGEFPNSYFFYLPRLCNHCTQPGCLEACPNDALFKTEEGLVLRNEDLCKGAQQCARACPYKKIYFNEKISKSEKCIFCYPRIEKGLPTACAQQCVGRVRWIGYRDDEEGPIYQLVEKYQVALPLHSDWGTEPNVFYVPPTAPDAYNSDGTPADEDRIPLSYLESLFGDGVRSALDTLEIERAKKQAGKDSALMDILIAYKHSDMFKLG